MAKPLYYRSTNPGLSSVTARASKLFEWDGTGSLPTEVQNGKAFMPPAEISGETVIWSDTYTLGYTDEANAAPVFFSDGAAGEVKVLEMINHIAGRLNQALFADLVSAKAWIATVQGVDFVEAGAGSGGSGSGSATTYTHTVSSGDTSMIIENNSSYPVTTFEFTNENGGTILPYAPLTAATQAWMPLEGGESVTVNGVHRWNAGGTMGVSLFLGFGESVNRRFKQYVNDVLVRTDVYSSQAFGNNFYGPGSTAIQAGDVVKYVIENV